MPWRSFLPRGLDFPAPVVVFSPGGGGTRDDESRYLGEHLASHGIASFHLQHRGSDADALEERGPEALFRAIVESEPSWAVLRQQDIRFALDRIEALAGDELRGRIDPSRAGMSGFSFGGVTTVVTAGQEYPPHGQTLADKRFRAAFALSPSARLGIAAPVLSAVEAAPLYRNMLMPVFHLTGTRDFTGGPSQTGPEHRRVPFDVTNNVDQYLLIIDGAEHRTFSGKDMPDPELTRKRELIKAAALVFWRAYLLDDREALAYLQDGGFRTALGSGGVLTFKPAASSRAR